MTAALQRDYVLIVDRSGSMGTADVHGKSRWEVAREGTEALARKIQTLDPDGVDLYTFANKFNRYENVTADKVAQIWQENEPNGGTNLAGVLDDALAHYFKKGTPATFIVVTDGEPNDRGAVTRSIVEASKKLEKDEDLAIQFIQIGNDPGARQFLQFLDDGLVEKQGAKFDIVDTKTQEETESMSFTELLTAAIND
jgi:hypothetical protein